MKINKILFGFTIVLAALFTSCNKDNEGAIYNNQGGAGLSFTASTLSSVEVPASNPVFDVEIVRGNIVGAASGNLTATLKVGDNELPGVTVSGYNFADGQNSTTVSVNVSPLEVGVVGSLTLTIADADASVGAIKSATMKVSKAYEWESLGKGAFVKGYERYRVMAPCEDYRLNPDPSDTWVASWSAPYIELWVEDGLVFFDKYFTGQNYDGDKTCPIYVYHPSAFSDLNSLEFWQHNKFLSDKVIQLAPYYYIDGLGGWNKTQTDGMILIQLP